MPYKVAVEYSAKLEIILYKEILVMAEEFDHKPAYKSAYAVVALFSPTLSADIALLFDEV